MPDAQGNLTLQDLQGGALGQYFGQTAGVQAGLQQQALAQQMQQFLQALQFQQQQAALNQALSYGTQFGYAPGGNYMSWGAGGPTQPAAGTPTLNAQQIQAGLGTSALQNAINQSMVTGQFAAPQALRYAPGTVLSAPSQTGGGNAYGVVNADGSLQMVSAQSLEQLAEQRGTTAQAMIANAQPVDWSTLQRLSQGPPTGPAQQTQAAQQQAYNQAVQSAALTGQFVNPTQTQDALLQQGKAMDGSSFTDLSPDQQQYWLQYNQNNPTAAAQQWARATNGALQQAGYQNPQAQGQQTLASQLQNAQLTGFYQGAPTEAASEFARNLALQQGQLGQQYLATAAQLQGPQNTFQLSNYLRGAQGNPNVPTYLQALQNNTNMPSFQATGSTAPTPQSAQGLIGQMGGGVQQGGGGSDQYRAMGSQMVGGGGTVQSAPGMSYGSSTPTYAQSMQSNGIPTFGGATTNYTGQGTSATPGWDYNSTLNSINQIAQRGAQSLGPGSLERLSPDELQAFGSGLGAAGYSLPSFLNQYAQSRVGQQAPVARTSLAA